MSGQGKQAKILTDTQIKTALLFLGKSRYSKRDHVLFLLSARAGLRAKEISCLTWGMVTDPEGNLSDTISLENKASKGASGRNVPLNPQLKAALIAWKECREWGAEDYIAWSERGSRMTANSVVMWFNRLYGNLGFDGCSSHSGRRTFITNAARKLSMVVGGSLKDVQEMAGHTNLTTTQRYIEGSSEAKKKLVALL